MHAASQYFPEEYPEIVVIMYKTSPQSYIYACHNIPEHWYGSFATRRLLLTVYQKKKYAARRGCLMTLLTSYTQFAASGH